MLTGIRAAARLLTGIRSRLRHQHDLTFMTPPDAADIPPSPDKDASFFARVRSTESYRSACSMPFR
jgi:hypothetical protein